MNRAAGFLTEFTSMFPFADLMGLAKLLLRRNLWQWYLEDLSHAERDEVMRGRLKDAIDRSNLRRAHLVERVNNVLTPFAVAPTSAIHISPVTFGQLLDQLSIGAIRAVATRDAVAHLYLEHIATATERILKLTRARVVAYPPAAPRKTYLGRSIE